VFGGNLALGQGISWNKPQEGLYRRNEVPVKGEQGFEENQEVIKPDIINQENDKVPIVMLSIAALSVAVLLIKKD
jgi:hypothetical protein